MKKNLFATVAAFIVVSACGQGDSGSDYGIPSGIYSVDPSHTYVTFSYLHQGLSYPLLRATGTAGELEFDANEISNSAVNITVAANSIRSNIDYFDKELASRKFFHADKYPHITFRSERYEPTDEFHGVLHGEVTIKETTLPLALNVTLNNALIHPMLDVPVVGFSATGSLKRSEFGLDRFVPVVSDDVMFNIEIEFLHGTDETNSMAADTARNLAAGG